MNLINQSDLFASSVESRRTGRNFPFLLRAYTLYHEQGVKVPWTHQVTKAVARGSRATVLWNKNVSTNPEGLLGTEWIMLSAGECIRDLQDLRLRNL